MRYICVRDAERVATVGHAPQMNAATGICRKLQNGISFAGADRERKPAPKAGANDRATSRSRVEISANSRAAARTQSEGTYL